MSMDDLKKYFACDKIKGRYQQAVAKETAQALIFFCEKEPEFRQAVEQSGKSYQQCLDKVVQKIGSSCSDLEVYRRAAKFYFPTAEVHFNMTIDLCGNTGAAIPTPEKPAITMTVRDVLNISLDELLNF